MKLRLSLTISLTRNGPIAPDEPEQHEHRDTDSVTETQPGDPDIHRMGFTPTTDPDVDRRED